MLAPERFSLYSLDEVRAITGVTVRQLQRWQELEMLWPEEPAPGRGYRPRFSAANISWICLLRDLTELGVDPARVKRASREGGVRGYAAHLEEAAEALRKMCPWWLD